MIWREGVKLKEKAEVLRGWRRRKGNLRKAGLGIHSSVFWVNRSFFCKKLANIEWMSNPLTKTSDSLIRSFLLSNLSESLMVAHFLWATRAICSHRALKKREWANRSFKKKLSKSVPKYNCSQKMLIKFSFFVNERANEWFAQKN